MEKVTKEFKITAPEDVMKRFERFLCYFHYNGGHSGLFAMGFDGDGSDSLKVDPAPDKSLCDGMEEHLGKDVEIAKEEGFGGAMFSKQESEEEEIVEGVILLKELL
jgi:hypothetical protein